MTREEWDMTRERVRSLITERDLAILLTGPTSGGEAARLAAWAFGRGPEYDRKPTGERWTYPEEADAE